MKSDGGRDGGVMAMAGERLAFLREIFLRRVAESDKRKAHRRAFFDPAANHRRYICIYTYIVYILSVSIKTCGVNLSLRSSPLPG